VDLLQPGESFVAAKGGRPGMGNCMLAGKTRDERASSRVHRSAGHTGTEAFYELELKAIAEVGLVGYPNAGKSSFLGAASNARPHVAPYPFTTLAPGIGVLEYSDFARVTVADLPGLVAGASQNRGLGHAFLRHVERVFGIAFVVDAAGVDGRDPSDDLQSLLAELALYQPALARKPAVVLANKCDLPEAQNHLPRLRALVAQLAADAQLDAEIAAEEEKEAAAAAAGGGLHVAGPPPRRGIQAMFETSMVSGDGLREAVVGIRACIMEANEK
jgi:GTP-binding protein